LTFENVKTTLLSGEHKLICPKCSTREKQYLTKKHGTKRYTDEKYSGRELQNYKCSNQECRYSFVLEKIYDDEYAKYRAMEMFIRYGWSYYRIAKELGYKADTIYEWVMRWLYSNHHNIYVKLLAMYK
jgi:hypothetical protein